MSDAHANPPAAAARRIAICSWSLKPENPEQLRTRIERLGLRAAQIALSPVVNNPPVWGSVFDVLREGGIDIVSGMMAMAGEDYSSLQSAAGLQLGLETGQESAETLCEALKDLDAHNLGVNFDPANMILYGMGDPIEAFKMLESNVFQVHIKDALQTRTPGAWGREVAAGQGEVDWPAFFDIARGIEPPIDYVIEREGATAREADLAIARDLIRRHVPDAN
jgi:sugar phosphate isomerase/epimerase